MRDSNAFNKKITLLRLEVAPGYNTSATEKARTVVWAKVYEPGVTTKMTALSTEEEIAQGVIMWRREYKDYTHAVIDGITYRIVQTGGTDNPLKIKLLLTRG